MKAIPIFTMCGLFIAAWLAAPHIQLKSKTIIYTNNNYGYTLTLPSSFANFVEENNFITIPTKDPNWNKQGIYYASVFEIQVTPKADMETITRLCSEQLATQGTWGSGCHPISHALGENNKYHFSYMRIDKETDYPADFSKSLFNEGSATAENITIFDVK